MFARASHVLAAGLVAWLAAASSAQAATPSRQDYLVCAGEDAQAAEAACSRIIEHARLGKQQLAEIHYSRGVSRYMLDDFAGAAADYGQALALWPDYTDARVYRGLAHEAAGKLGDAIEDYSAAIAQAPERKHDVLPRRAQAYVSQEAWDEAAADYRELAAMQTDDADLRYRLGYVLERAARLLDAHAAYAEAAVLGNVPAAGRVAALAPRVAILRAGVALQDWDACMQAGQARLAACDRILSAPNTLAAAELAKVYFKRGFLREAAGDAQGALADYSAVLQRVPGHAGALYNRAALYQARGDADAAADDYDVLIAAQPQHWQARFQRGRLYFAQGDMPAAIEDFDATIDLHPQEANVYLYRALALQAEGADQAALADYDAALERDGKSAYAHYNRGALRQRLGDLDGAAADYDAALALQPGHAAALNNRGVVRQSQGELEAALQDYQAALAADPGNARAAENLDNLKTLLEQRKSTAQAG